ncbi:hypothetical protein CEXT_43881 [Caerostris extrusa]|uniref:Uncharacterized protein n=1 Tax=Caerostris extrusa TaxID=172846 RepID=A0AAV4Y044_CAEEX|nr:hypothetical protein CEXT_43881 [Caerostris extrusa]
MKGKTIIRPSNFLPTLTWGGNLGKTPFDLNEWRKFNESGRRPKQTTQGVKLSVQDEDNAYPFPIWTKPQSELQK